MPDKLWFDFKIKDTFQQDPVKYIPAAKAIIYQNNQLLMVTSNKNDVTFPGGRSNDGEALWDVLKREVLEETGHEIQNPKLVGQILHHAIARKNPNAIVRYHYHYYLVDLKDEVKKPLHLDAYESDLEMKPIWLSIDKAIQMNKKAIDHQNINKWTQREYQVLNLIKPHF